MEGQAYALVDDELKVDGDGAAVDVGVVLRLVDEDGDALGADLLRPVAEHEEHRVDHVRFAAAVRADDRRERFVERTQDLRSIGQTTWLDDTC